MQDNRSKLKQTILKRPSANAATSSMLSPYFPSSTRIKQMYRGKQTENRGGKKELTAHCGVKRHA
jgi:hypothetical protein